LDATSIVFPAGIDLDLERAKTIKLGGACLNWTPRQLIESTLLHREPIDAGYYTE
jgi:hypothetical protein